MKFKDSLTPHTYPALMDKLTRAKMNPSKVLDAGKALLKTETPTAPPFWKKACDNKIWEKNVDFSVDGNIGSKGLADLMSVFEAKKKEIEERILGWITIKLPDGIRPILLTILQAKQLLQLVEFIKCCTKILAAIQKWIRQTIASLQSVVTSLTSYLNKCIALIKSIEAQILNMPNALIDAALEMYLGKLQSYINEAMEAIATGNVFAALQALQDLKAQYESIAITVNSLKAVGNSLRGQALSNFSQLMSSAKELTNMNDIRAAQAMIPSKYGWFASGSITSASLYASLIHATDVLTWADTARSIESYVAEQESLRAASSQTSEIRASTVDSLSHRISEAELFIGKAEPPAKIIEQLNYTNQEFVFNTTTPEILAYHEFVQTPATSIDLKLARAKALVELIESTESQELEDAIIIPKQLAGIQDAIDLIDRWIDMNESIEATKADIADNEAKIAFFIALGEEYANKDLAAGFDALAALGDSSLYMTLTNDNDMFEEYDGVTKSDLLNVLSNFPTNQWYDVFSSNAEGTLIIPDSNILKLLIAKTAYVINTERSLGLRLILNNGLWILDCYGRGDPAENENKVKEDPYTVVYARFSAVPLAPNDTTTVPMTYEQWRTAINHPAVVNGDSDYIIAGEIPPITDTKQVTFSVGNPNTYNQWTRFLTQQEINERESDYLAALQSLSLSAISGVVEVTHWANLKRTYSLVQDTQIKDLLLNKKPFTNMQIPVKLVNLQFCKILTPADTSTLNLDSLLTSEPIYLLPSTTLPFAFSATWGFLAKTAVLG